MRFVNSILNAASILFWTSVGSLSHHHHLSLQKKQNIIDTTKNHFDCLQLSGLSILSSELSIVVQLPIQTFLGRYVQRIRS